MAWYHVGACDCPVGCCDCGPPPDPRPTHIKQVDDIEEEQKKILRTVNTMADKITMLQEANARLVENEGEKYKSVIVRAEKEADEIIKEAKLVAKDIVKNVKAKTASRADLKSTVKLALKNKTITKSKLNQILRVWFEIDCSEVKQVFEEILNARDV